jgi:hypothetical protein
MRQFMRHASNVPVEIRRVGDAAEISGSGKNVGFGGLAFLTETAFPPDTTVALRIPCVRPVFEVAAARVAWCKREGGQYAVGVQFPDSDVAFRVRMVEQICHIENYRRDVEIQEGRKLTTEEAAKEWIRRYGSSFPNP